MTLVNIKQEFDTSLASTASEGVLTRVFADIETFSRPALADEAWFGEILTMLQFSQSIEIGFGHAKAWLLAIVREQWENMPFELRRQNGYDFMTFAKNWTGKARSTIDGYTQTAQVWLVDEFGKGKRVDIVDRDSSGAPILENGHIRIKTVDFVAWQVDMSKLTILNARAKAGDMTETLWEMLVDDFFTCDDLRAQLYSQNDASAPDYSLRYEIIGPGVFATQNGRTVMIAESLNWEEYDTDDLVKAGIDHFLEVTGTPLDEDLIYKQTHKQQAITLTETMMNETQPCKSA